MPFSNQNLREDHRACQSQQNGKITKYVQNKMWGWKEPQIEDWVGGRDVHQQLWYQAINYSPQPATARNRNPLLRPPRIGIDESLQFHRSTILLSQFPVESCWCHATPKRVSGWWLVHPSEKYESQSGWLETQYFWENKKWQPNHQPGMAHAKSSSFICTTSTMRWSDVGSSQKVQRLKGCPPWSRQYLAWLVWSLVGGFKIPLKNIRESVGMMKFPLNMDKWNMFQITNQK